MADVWSEFLIQTVSVWEFFPVAGLTDTPDLDESEGAPYATGLACAIQSKGSEQVMNMPGVSQIDYYKCYFATNPGFKRKDLIKWTDSSGVAHRLQVTGVTDNTKTFTDGLVEVSCQERLF